MNVKVIGSIIRWTAVVIGAAGAFAGDSSFMEALAKLKEGISSGDVGTIIASAVTAITLGWSIWDKIQTQKKEDEAEAKIKSLNSTIEVQTLALSKK